MSDDAVLIVSADCHAGPPVDRYREWVDPAWRDEYDRFVVAHREWRTTQNRSMGLPDDGELIDSLFGEDMIEFFKGNEALGLEGSTGVWDSDRRTGDLEAEGIAAEVIFPDFQNRNEPPWGAAFPFPDTDARRRREGARAYNRWLADFCDLLPGRRAGLAIVQPHDVEAAVADVTWAAGRGLAGIMLPTGDTTLASYHDSRYDPLWAACVDAGLSVTFHSGGTPWEGYGWHAMWSTKLEFLWWSHRPLWQCIFGGVFERFPALEMVFTEQGADWIPDTLGRLDEQYFSPFERAVGQLLSKSPTEYWHSNCYVGASFMSRGEAEIRDQLGVSRIMWGADYPHIEGTWPRSRDALRDTMNGCREDELRQMVGLTAARVYGFDVAALRAVADRIGPHPADLLSEPAPPPVHYDPVDYATGRVSTKESARRIAGLMAGPSRGPVMS
ncbi:MAG: amidohydrolase [Acidobacteriota bacterium]|nr:amidohydrolase [Acidobacteriota bacterium]